MKRSIGITVYENALHLEALLSCLTIFKKREGNDAEIIVVDDGSSSEIASRVQTICATYDAMLVRHHVNKGVPAAWNSLLKNAKGEYVIICNDDIRVDNFDVFRAIWFALEANDSVGIASAREVNLDGNGRIIQTNFSESDVPLIQAWPSGSLFGVKKSLLAQKENPDGSRGFWESLQIYGEEWDAGFWLSQRGYFTCVLRNVEYFHLRGSSTGAIRKARYDIREFQKLNLEQMQDALRSRPQPTKLHFVSQLLARLTSRLGIQSRLVSRPTLSNMALALRYNDERFVSEPAKAGNDCVANTEVAWDILVENRVARKVPLMIEDAQELGV